MRARSVGAVLEVRAAVVLRPEAMQGKGTVLGALGCGGMAVAKLWRPGEIEQVVVEGLAGVGGLSGAGLVPG